MKKFIVHKHNISKPTTNEDGISIDDLLESENAGCLSINVDNFLDSIKYEDRDTILKDIISKLRYDGKLIIFGLDYNSISSNNIYNKHKIEMINKAIFENRESCECCFKLASFLMDNNCVDIKTEINDLYYTIICKRKSC